MKSKRHLLFLLMLIVLAGCSRDIPEPKSKQDEKSVTILENKPVRTVAATPHSAPFEVRHQVNGRNVLIECKLQDISFRRDQPDKQIGKILVSVDGKITAEMDSPVFIIKGLTTGKHSISLQVVNLKNQPLPLKQELQVNIL